MNRQKEFVNQLKKEINRTYEQLDEAKQKLLQAVEQEHVILNFGLAKYAEQVTALTSRLSALNNQLNICESLFLFL